MEDRERRLNHYGRIGKRTNGPVAPLSQEDHELKELEANLSYTRVCLNRARWERKTAIVRAVSLSWGVHHRFHPDTVHSR